MATRYDRDNLPPEGDFQEYRKRGTTLMAPLAGPAVVVTKEREYSLPDGWQGFLALDRDSDPYPVEARDGLPLSYEPVTEEGLFGWSGQP
jgi:hypothetical protein